MSEQPELSTFVVLDLDRTLLDTARLVQAYTAMLSEKFGRQLVMDLTEAQLNSEDREVSFDVYSYLAAGIGADEVGQFNGDFLSRHEHVDMLNDGAVDLLMSLSIHNQKYGILTQGSQSWQLFKLMAARLGHVPYVITDQPRKAGITVASWQQANGQFKVPCEFDAGADRGGGVYDRILEVDDKLSALEDMPDGAQGLLYVGGRRPGEVAAVYADLPESIQLISHLQQVSGYIQPQDVARRALSTSRKRYASI